MNTGVVARMDIDAVPLPAEPISAEQAVDEVLTALQEHQATTVTRADLTAAYEGIKGAVVEAIKARLAASQPGHQTAPGWQRHASEPPAEVLSSTQ